MNKFAKVLLTWHEANPRPMPWLHTNDPYKIWISEIILQQTRVDQGLPYYNNFIKKFPTIRKLAKANLDEVLLQWQGLGYYSRARNLHHTANVILDSHRGKFPTTHADILKLKGIGPYTAAAIMSFAYGQAIPAIDGNVQRVVSRVLALDQIINTPASQKIIHEFLQQYLPVDQARNFNQAMINLGALVCKPKDVECGQCPLNYTCLAFKSGTQLLYPIKNKATSKKIRYFHYLVIHDKKHIYLQQRQHDIWQGLYQFPLIERAQADRLKLQQMHIHWEGLSSQQKIKDLPPKIIKLKKHILSHQEIYILIYIAESDNLMKSDYIKVKKDDLKDYAFPIVLRKFINNFLVLQLEK